jgi:hypothetical protein
MNVLRAEVVAQALRMLEVLDHDRPGARDALAANAWSELEAWDGLQLRLVPDSQTDERCSVAGGYVHTTVPPTLTVTNSLSPGPRSFTVLPSSDTTCRRTTSRSPALYAASRPTRMRSRTPPATRSPHASSSPTTRLLPCSPTAARPPRRWSGCSRRLRRAGPRAALASSSTSGPAVSSRSSTTPAASCSPAGTAT